MNHRLEASGRAHRRQATIAANPPVPALPGPLVLDLVAALVESGAPPTSALRDTGAVLADRGDPRGARLLRLADLIGATTELSAQGHEDRTTMALAEALSLAGRSGLPPSALIRSAAEGERRQRKTDLGKTIRRTEVLLVIPGAVCLLPAFVLLGMAPVAIRLMTG